MERQEFEEKIKVIKYVILSKLNLLSDYMNKQVKFNLEDHIGMGYENFDGHEFWFTLQVSLDCDDCGFEPLRIGSEVRQFMGDLRNASIFPIDSRTLKVNTGNECGAGTKLDSLEFFDNDGIMNLELTLRIDIN